MKSMNAANIAILEMRFMIEFFIVNLKFLPQKAEFAL